MPSAVVGSARDGLGRNPAICPLSSERGGRRDVCGSDSGRTCVNVSMRCNSILSQYGAAASDSEREHAPPWGSPAGRFGEAFIVGFDHICQASSSVRFCREPAPARGGRFGRSRLSFAPSRRGEIGPFSGGPGVKRLGGVHRCPHRAGTMIRFQIGVQKEPR